MGDNAEVTSVPELIVLCETISSKYVIPTNGKISIKFIGLCFATSHEPLEIYTRDEHQEKAREKCYALALNLGRHFCVLIGPIR
jgi:hypothetical protein